MKDTVKEFEGCPPVLSKEKCPWDPRDPKALLFQGSVEEKKVNKQLV